MKEFWRWSVTDKVNEPDIEPERELFLEGPIAEETWFEDEVTPAAFKEQLCSGTGNVIVHLNSPGGDCVAASMIYTMLMDYPGDVEIHIDGMAASAASVIAMAGTKVLMAPTAMMMIHDPLTQVYGNKADLKEAIKLLDEFKESIINAYEIKTGMEREQIAKLMEDEGTWMNAKKALELGFIDAILFTEEDENGIKNSVEFSQSVVTNSLVSKLMAKHPHEEQPHDEVNVMPEDTERVSAASRMKQSELYDKIIF